MPGIGGVPVPAEKGLGTGAIYTGGPYGGALSPTMLVRPISTGQQELAAEYTVLQTERKHRGDVKAELEKLQAELKRLEEEAKARKAGVEALTKPTGAVTEEERAKQTLQARFYTSLLPSISGTVPTPDLRALEAFVGVKAPRFISQAFKQALGAATEAEKVIAVETARAQREQALIVAAGQQLKNIFTEYDTAVASAKVAQKADQQRLIDQWNTQYAKPQGQSPVATWKEYVGAVTKARTDYAEYQAGLTRGGPVYDTRLTPSVAMPRIGDISPVTGGKIIGVTSQGVVQTAKGSYYQDTGRAFVEVTRAPPSPAEPAIKPLDIVSPTIWIGGKPLFVTGVGPTFRPTPAPVVTTEPVRAPAPAAPGVTFEKTPLESFASLFGAIPKLITSVSLPGITGGKTPLEIIAEKFGAGEQAKKISDTISTLTTVAGPALIVSAPVPAAPPSPVTGEIPVISGVLKWAGKTIIPLITPVVTAAASVVALPKLLFTPLPIPSPKAELLKTEVKSPPAELPSIQIQPTFAMAGTPSRVLERPFQPLDIFSYLTGTPIPKSTTVDITTTSVYHPSPTAPRQLPGKAEDGTVKQLDQSAFAGSNSPTTVSKAYAPKFAAGAVTGVIATASAELKDHPLSVKDQAGVDAVNDIGKKINYQFDKGTPFSDADMVSIKNQLLSVTTDPTAVNNYMRLITAQNTIVGKSNDIGNILQSANADKRLLTKDEFGVLMDDADEINKLDPATGARLFDSLSGIETRQYVELQTMNLMNDTSSRQEDWKINFNTAYKNIIDSVKAMGDPTLLADAQSRLNETQAGNAVIRVIQDKFSQPKESSPYIPGSGSSYEKRPESDPEFITFKYLLDASGFSPETKTTMIGKYWDADKASYVGHQYNKLITMDTTPGWDAITRFQAVAHGVDTYMAPTTDSAGKTTTYADTMVKNLMDYHNIMMPPSPLQEWVRGAMKEETIPGKVGAIAIPILETTGVFGPIAQFGAARKYDVLGNLSKELISTDAYVRDTLGLPKYTPTGGWLDLPGVAYETLIREHPVSTAATIAALAAGGEVIGAATTAYPSLAPIADIGGKALLGAQIFGTAKAVAEAPDIDKLGQIGVGLAELGLMIGVGKMAEWGAPRTQGPEVRGAWVEEPVTTRQKLGMFVAGEPYTGQFGAFRMQLGEWVGGELPGSAVIIPYGAPGAEDVLSAMTGKISRLVSGRGALLAVTEPGLGPVGEPTVTPFRETTLPAVREMGIAGEEITPRLIPALPQIRVGDLMAGEPVGGEILPAVGVGGVPAIRETGLPTIRLAPITLPTIAGVGAPPRVEVPGARLPGVTPEVRLPIIEAPPRVVVPAGVPTVGELPPIRPDLVARAGEPAEVTPIIGRSMYTERQQSFLSQAATEKLELDATNKKLTDLIATPPDPAAELEYKARFGEVTPQDYVDIVEKTSKNYESAINSARYDVAIKTGDYNNLFVSAAGRYGLTPGDIDNFTSGHMYKVTPDVKIPIRPAKKVSYTQDQLDVAKRYLEWEGKVDTLYKKATGKDATIDMRVEEKIDKIASEMVLKTKGIPKEVTKYRNEIRKIDSERGDVLTAAQNAGLTPAKLLEATGAIVTSTGESRSVLKARLEDVAFGGLPEDVPIVRYFMDGQLFDLVYEYKQLTKSEIDAFVKGDTPARNSAYTGMKNVYNAARQLGVDMADLHDLARMKYDVVDGRVVVNTPRDFKFRKPKTELVDTLIEAGKMPPSKADLRPQAHIAREEWTGAARKLDEARGKYPDPVAELQHIANIGETITPETYLDVVKKGARDYEVAINEAWRDAENKRMSYERLIDVINAPRVVKPKVTEIRRYVTESLLEPVEIPKLVKPKPKRGARIGEVEGPRAQPVKPGEQYSSEQAIILSRIKARMEDYNTAVNRVGGLRLGDESALRSAEYDAYNKKTIYDALVRSAIEKYGLDQSDIYHFTSTGRYIKPMPAMPAPPSEVTAVRPDVVRRLMEFVRELPKEPAKVVVPEVTEPVREIIAEAIQPGDVYTPTHIGAAQPIIGAKLKYEAAIGTDKADTLLGEYNKKLMELEKSTGLSAEDVNAIAGGYRSSPQKTAVDYVPYSKEELSIGGRAAKVLEEYNAAKSGRAEWVAKEAEGKWNRALNKAKANGLTEADIVNIGNKATGRLKDITVWPGDHIPRILDVVEKFSPVEPTTPAKKLPKAVGAGEIYPKEVLTAARRAAVADRDYISAVEGGESARSIELKNLYRERSINVATRYGLSKDEIGKIAQGTTIKSEEAALPEGVVARAVRGITEGVTTPERAAARKDVRPVKWKTRREAGVVDLMTLLGAPAEAASRVARFAGKIAGSVRAKPPVAEEPALRMWEEVAPPAEAPPPLAKSIEGIKAEAARFKKTMETGEAGELSEFVKSDLIRVLRGKPPLASSIVPPVAAKLPGGIDIDAIMARFGEATGSKEFIAKEAKAEEVAKGLLKPEEEVPPTRKGRRMDKESGMATLEMYAVPVAVVAKVGKAIKGFAGVIRGKGVDALRGKPPEMRPSLAEYRRMPVRETFAREFVPFEVGEGPITEGVRGGWRPGSRVPRPAILEGEPISLTELAKLRPTILAGKMPIAGEPIAAPVEAVPRLTPAREKEIVSSTITRVNALTDEMNYYLRKLPRDVPSEDGLIYTKETPMGTGNRENYNLRARELKGELTKLFKDTSIDGVVRALKATSPEPEARDFIRMIIIPKVLSDSVNRVQDAKRRIMENLNDQDRRAGEGYKTQFRTIDSYDVRIEFNKMRDELRGKEQEQMRRILGPLVDTGYINSDALRRLEMARMRDIGAASVGQMENIGELSGKIPRDIPSIGRAPVYRMGIVYLPVGVVTEASRAARIAAERKAEEEAAARAAALREGVGVIPITEEVPVVESRLRDITVDLSASIVATGTAADVGTRALSLQDVMLRPALRMVQVEEAVKIAPPGAEGMRAPTPPPPMIPRPEITVKIPPPEIPIEPTPPTPPLPPPTFRMPSAPSWIESAAFPYLGMRRIVHPIATPEQMIGRGVFDIKYRVAAPTSKVVPARTSAARIAVNVGSVVGNIVAPTRFGPIKTTRPESAKKSVGIDINVMKIIERYGAVKAQKVITTKKPSKKTIKAQQKAFEVKLHPFNRKKPRR